jgi:chromosome segregation ATPase
MSSEPEKSSPDIEQDASTESDGEPHSESPAESPTLTLTLPDGSESVSDAIVANREMLREPQENGLATEQDITHLSEAMEALSTEVDEVGTQSEETQSTVDELKTVVKQQQRQIDELQSMVASLTDILGTEADWQTFDDE